MKINEFVVESPNESGDRVFGTYAAWKRAVKQIYPIIWFNGDQDICQALVGPKPFVRGKTKSIGEWDGSTGLIYKRRDVREWREVDDLIPDMPDEWSAQPELSSNADSKMENAVKKVCDQYKGQGHAQVELLPFLTKVIGLAKKPVTLADLIAINKKSPHIRSIIDSIDEKKVKFKNMSVKNEDPAKKQEKKDTTISSMASRAAGKLK